MRRVMEAATTRSPQSNRGSDDALTSVERGGSAPFVVFGFSSEVFSFLGEPCTPPWEWEFTVLRTNVSFLSLGEPSNRFRCISGRAQETG